MPPVRPRSGGGIVKAGDNVLILPLGVQGRIDGLTSDNLEAEVISGGIRMRIPVKDLTPVQGKESGPTRPPTPAPVAYSGTCETRTEINLLGKTVQEALDSMDRLLDRSLMGSFQTLRIVHGRGTGALKRAIHEVLRDDPRVSSFGPAPMNEGGDGVTVVELKG